MNNKKIISLEETSKYCFKILSSNNSMDEVLNTVSDHLIRDFGNYISPGKLSFFDEVKINFIELLDQIIYEYRENTNYDLSIKDYIISDLYSRLTLNLEAFNDMDLYKKNIKQRSLYPDDLLIIRAMNLKDLVPFIVEEWDEITNLHKAAIKTLLYFKDSKLLKTFEEILHNSFSTYIKSAALLGISYCSDEKLIIPENMRSNEGMDYIEKFNLRDLSINKLPSNPVELVFALLHTEKIISNENSEYSLLWILKLLNIMPSMDIKNSWSTEIDNSLSNIFIKIDSSMLMKLLNTEERLISFINFIDYLPRNIFNRITGRLDSLDQNFHFRINSIIEKEKVDIKETNSNIFNYICWNSTKKV